MKVLILEEALRINWDPSLLLRGFDSGFFAGGSFGSPISTHFFFRCHGFLGWDGLLFLGGFERRRGFLFFLNLHG